MTLYVDDPLLMRLPPTQKDWTYYGRELSGFLEDRFLRTLPADPLDWEAALSVGGTWFIEGGTYTVAEIDLPAVDLTLIPLGPVVLEYPITADYALKFDAHTLVSADVVVTAVAEDLTFPTTTTQAVTKLTGTFTGFARGDICSIRADEEWADTNCLQAEMFTVLDVGAADAYILADRVLYFTYTPAANTPKVNRFTATPKLTIAKGITLKIADDPAGVNAGDFKWGLILDGAVRADVTIAAEGTYSGAMYLVGCFDCDVNFAGHSFYVDYTNEAWGYGVVEYGCSYGNRLRLKGYKTGKLQEANGTPALTYSAQWNFLGIPQASDILELISIAPYTAAGGTHLAIRPHYGTYVVHGVGKADIDVDTTQEFHVAISGAMIDGVFDNVEVDGVGCLINLKDQFSTQTSITIHNLKYSGFETSSGAVAYGLVRMIADQTGDGAALRPVINILGGHVQSPKGYAIDTDVAGTHNNGYKLVASNVVFTRVLGLMRWKSTMLMEAHLHNCTWEADADSIAVVTAVTNDVPAGLCNIWGLDIVSLDGTRPLGVGRHQTAGKTINLSYGRIRVNLTPFKWQSVAPFATVGTVTQAALLDQTGIT